MHTVDGHAGLWLGEETAGGNSVSSYRLCPALIMGPSYLPPRSHDPLGAICPRRIYMPVTFVGRIGVSDPMGSPKVQRAAVLSCLVQAGLPPGNQVLSLEQVRSTTGFLVTCSPCCGSIPTAVAIQVPLSCHRKGLVGASSDALPSRAASTCWVCPLLLCAKCVCSCELGVPLLPVC